jgi:nitronate monooxygenase
MDHSPRKASLTTADARFVHIRGRMRLPLIAAPMFRVSDGHALHAAVALGCDLAYMGTRFIATHESLAPPAYKEMLVAASADDVLLTRAFTGLQTNMLRPSIIAAGLDPDTLPERGMIDVAKDINLETQDERPRRWRDIWSAGHSTSGVRDILSVETLIAQTECEYRAASSVLAKQGDAWEET